MLTRLKALLAISLLVVLTTGTMVLAANRLKGQVVSVGAESLVLSADATQTVVAVNQSTRITVDGEEAGLQDVMPGFTATVSASEQDGRLIASSVDAYAQK